MGARDRGLRVARHHAFARYRLTVARVTSLYVEGLSSRHEGEVFYIGRKTNAATAPAVTRTRHMPRTNSALTRGAPHTGSDIRLNPHMNGAKAAGEKTMAMRRARTPFPHNICEPAPLNTLVRLGGLQGRRRRAKRP